jgi:hypothetical protein
VLPWPAARAAGPFGGLISSVRDQLRYARFHLGDGAAPDGTRLLARETLARMRTPAGPGGTMGTDDLDGVGLSWLLRSVEGTRLAQHGGFHGGQQSTLVLVPEREFAVTVLTNAVTGLDLHRDVTRWALREYLGLDDAPPTPRDVPTDGLAEYAGRYGAPAPAGLPVRPPYWDVRAADDHLVLALVDPNGPAGAPPALQTRAAFYREDHLVALDPPEEGLLLDFVRWPDGRIGWLRFGGRLEPRHT